MRVFNRLLMVLVLSVGAVGSSAKGASRLATQGDRFLLNGRKFDMWGVRVASASQNQEYTEALIAALDSYKAHGVNAVTVFVQGSSGGFSDPFSPDGKSLDAGHLARIKRIIAACDERRMAAVVGVFYQRAMANKNGVRKLQSSEAVVQAVRTVTEALRDCENIIINIANEQNSGWYDNMQDGAERLYDFRDPKKIVSLCRVVHEVDADRLAGGGGYDDAGNVVIGCSEDVDALLFDTCSRDIEAGQDSGWHYDYFVKNGVRDKPIVNVELYGGWTKKFVTSSGKGGRYPQNGRLIHFGDVDAACERPGLSVFLHSNPWFQGPSMGLDARFDIGGAGTEQDPGLRWYFEYVRRKTAPHRRAEGRNCRGEIILSAR